MVALAGALTLAVAGGLAGPPVVTLPADPTQRGSLVNAAPLGKRSGALKLGGGLALIVPFYDLEFGYGVGRNVDLLARYETVVGLHHRPRVGMRWALARVGTWSFGMRASLDATFFGLASDRVDLTASMRTVGGLAFSGPVRGSTVLIIGLDGEFQFVEWTRLDGDTQTTVGYEYTATTPRIGVQTPLTRALDLFVMARIRVPTDAVILQARTFYVFPFLEIGGTFGW